jgi:hypothetical protein
MYIIKSSEKVAKFRHFEKKVINRNCSHREIKGGLNSGEYPASCTRSTGDFPGSKCGRGVLLNTHPLLVPRLKKERGYTSSPPMRQ